jgi:hypothetical protein
MTACGGRALPPPVAKAVDKACKALARAAGETTPKKIAKLVRKAIASWRRASKLARKKRWRQTLSPECAETLPVTLADAGQRSGDASAR